MSDCRLTGDGFRCTPSPVHPQVPVKIRKIKKIFKIILRLLRHLTFSNMVIYYGITLNNDKADHAEIR